MRFARGLWRSLTGQREEARETLAQAPGVSLTTLASFNASYRPWLEVCQPGVITVNAGWHVGGG